MTIYNTVYLTLINILTIYSVLMFYQTALSTNMHGLAKRQTSR